VSETSPAPRLLDARLAALDAATRAIAGELDLDRVLQLIVDSVRVLVGARYAALGMPDRTGRITRFITSGIDAETREGIGHPPQGRGLLGLIIREGRTLRTSDIAAHPDAVGMPPNHPPMRSFLGVPIRVRRGVVGNFYLTEKAGGEAFDEEDEQLVEQFAVHAGIAIETARLHAKERQLAVIDERDRIGRDLHDGIIQALYAVALSLEDVPDLMRDDAAEATARVDRAIERLNLTIRELRNFILGLGSEMTAEAGLVAGLATLADELRLSMLVDIDLVVDGASGAADTLSVESASQLLQMAREALSNVARHSGATRASITLGEDADDLVLAVGDNGRGFDPREASRPGHFGLANLRERAASLGGTLSVESERGAGTRIIVRLPRQPRESIRT
jgi:signal transduction histidine kinase